MKIETAFDIHNIVKRKFDTDGPDETCAFEVMEVISNSCYAGTQVFYLCRQLVAVRKYDIKRNEDRWVNGHAINRQDDSSTGWLKYREDELIAAPQEVIDVFLGLGVTPNQ